MASLDLILWPALRPKVVGQIVEWRQTSRPAIEQLPVIFWGSGEAWSEANLWALHQTAQSRDTTVERCMDHLLAYARWLEAENLCWWHFPAAERHRCLVRFKGALVKARDAGELAPSTTSQRMAAVVRFYRWAKATGLISTEWPMWSERQVGIKLVDSFGLEHTLNVSTTNLAIPNKKVAGAMQLEDGLMPVSIAQMREILEIAQGSASQELLLMLRLGFGTGMRIGSICDLKVQTLENAQKCPLLGSTGWYRLSLGPAARPTVSTKGAVSGTVLVPMDLLEDLREYSSSTRRLKRQSQAAEEHRGLLFLTSIGGPYWSKRTKAINVEMSRLRGRGSSVLRDFHFHRSRATFLTRLMRAALSCLPVGDAVDFVREAALHRDEATTLKYVKFVETTKAMSEAADAFTLAFMGATREHKNA